MEPLATPGASPAVQVLYDFLVCRGDYRGAARAMAAYAWRLRAEAPSTAEAVAEALRAYGGLIESTRPRT